MAAPAQGVEQAAKQGNRSLAKVLAADSAVGVLAKGRTQATAFVPTDAAFRRLVTDLTGKRPKSRSPTASTACCARSTSEATASTTMEPV